MNKTAYIILFSCLSAVYLQAADKEQAQAKSSCAAPAPTAPAPVIPYNDRYFEAFKLIVARSKFRVSKEEWKRMYYLDFKKTNCTHSQIWCCESFTGAITLNSATPIATHSIPFNKFYTEHITKNSKDECPLESLLFETHPGHLCIAIDTGLDPKTPTRIPFHHSFTVEKYSNTSTCWWRIYQSYIKTYSLAEWLRIDTPCHTDDEQAIAEIQEYGGGQKLTKQELLNFILLQTTLLLKGIEDFPTVLEKYRNNIKLTAKAYTVHPKFYTDMDDVLAKTAFATQQTATTAPSLAAGPEPTNSNSAPSLAAQPAGAS